MSSFFPRVVVAVIVILVAAIIAVPTVSSQVSEDYHGKDLLSDLHCRIAL
jgi:hypothetical protein